MKVRLLKTAATEFRDLSADVDYDVLGVEANHVRILNCDSQPYLYPLEIFLVVDPSIPEGWITTVGNDGETYSYPLELNDTGFFEDFFDRNPEAIARFGNYLRNTVKEDKQSQTS